MHYRLAGYDAHDERTEDDFWFFCMDSDVLHPLATHHTPDGQQSYFILADHAATYGPRPGTASLIALHVTRDIKAKTFQIASDRLPILSFAQRWLIARGCPVEAIRMPADHPFTKPADALTAELEEHLLTSASERYEVLDDYTDDDMVFTATALVRDHDPGSRRRPYRIFHEDTDLTSHTHTLREGAWADIDAAGQWLIDREGPLPSPHTQFPQASPVPPATAARASLGRPPGGPTPPSPGFRR
ncbi:glycosyl hydrolase [Streptomyces decoyicus]|uniref:glycosyl hydrolase n=1 Tax=Streptomyces decoyicus TaxID=249567 RepID=UPI003870E497